jgi:dimethylglycine dehydrogenase
MARGRERALVYLDVEPDPDEPADVIGDEPIWHDGEVVGWVTSGAYAHHSRRSLALGYVPAALAQPGADFEVEVIGHRRPARLLTEPVFDPAGRRMRE